jgi:hypothetical protein
MRSRDTKDRFAQLRAKGLSLARIASELHVSQRAIVAWNRQLYPGVRALRPLRLRALHERSLPSRQQDPGRLARTQSNLEAPITKRDFSRVVSQAKSNPIKLNQTQSR